MDIEVLITKALEARAHSYSPYSGFCVGAAVYGENGKIYQGCNIENASYGATVCAERNALFAAVYDGCRRIKAVAVAGGDHDETIPTTYAYPCGICRQVMTEFCEKDAVIIAAKSTSDYREFKLSELIPCSFEL